MTDPSPTPYGPPTPGRLPTSDALFRAWAPDGSPWSPWAKPVLFAHYGEVRRALDPSAGGASAEALAASSSPAGGAADLPPADGRTAVVVDLPGPASVAAGLRLAKLGYRPVPLFNAVSPPGFPGEPLAAVAAVDVRPILAALVASAEALSALVLPPEAPPAFLLDHARRTGHPEPGQFDNRSVSLPTDFPSGHLLQSRGVERVVVAQPGSGQPQEDLRHTLVRWQREGLAILVRPTDPPGPPEPIDVVLPSGFGRVWQRALAVLGLRRYPLGGFGGTLPEPGGGGGGGG